jgi:hypothetical protein
VPTTPDRHASRRPRRRAGGRSLLRSRPACPGARPCRRRRRLGTWRVGHRCRCLRTGWRCRRERQTSRTGLQPRHGRGHPSGIGPAGPRRRQSASLRLSRRRHRSGRGRCARRPYRPSQCRRPDGRCRPRELRHRPGGHPRRQNGSQRHQNARQRHQNARRRHQNARQRLRGRWPHQNARRRHEKARQRHQNARWRLQHGGQRQDRHGAYRSRPRRGLRVPCPACPRRRPGLPARPARPVRKHARPARLTRPVRKHARPARLTRPVRKHARPARAVRLRVRPRRQARASCRQPGTPSRRPAARARSRPPPTPSKLAVRADIPAQAPLPHWIHRRRAEGRYQHGSGPQHEDVRRRPTLPRGPPRSTIGAEGLNFRVRNGTGCFPFAMAAETLWRCQASRLPG